MQHGCCCYREFGGHSVEKDGLVVERACQVKLREPYFKKTDVCKPEAKKNRMLIRRKVEKRFD